jgi:hypothetical protein
VEHWKNEHQHALDDLKKVLELMRYRARCLELHRVAIDNLETRMRVRENAVQLYETGEGDSRRIKELARELCGTHEQVQQEHLLQQNVHSKLFRLHREMLDEIHHLLQSLEPVEGIVKCTAKIGKNQPK